MTTMSAAQYLPLAELRRRDLSNAFGVTFQIWENDLDWRCQDYAIATPPDLARWFDNLASQNLEAALTDQLYSEPIDHELWIAAPIWQESENQLLMLAAPMPADPAVMIRICANLYARTQLQATQLDDQQTLIDSYANHMSANYEEIYFLRQLSKSIEFCDATRDLNSVAASILPALLPLMGAAAVEFIPSSVAVAFASEDETATEIREGEVPWSHAEHQLMTGWFQREVQRKLFIWNRSNGLKTPAGEVFPDELQSLLIVPVNKENQCFGWLIAYNKLRDDSTLVQEQKLLGTDEFGSVEASLMQSAAVLLASHALNGQLFHEQEKLIVDIIHTLVSVIEAKDIYTCGHSNRVAMFARCLAEQMGLPEQDCENIYLSGLLHDVGKVGVADDILLKPDKLSPEEYECIKTHPERGYRILQGLKPLANLLPGVLHHHEAINGKGYPHGLKDQEIPLMARVIAVADAYDALTSDRAYRKGMSLEKTEEILLKERGQQWDATVIDAYFAVREKIREIALHWSNALFIQLVANPQEVENSVTHSNDHRVRKAVAARRKQS